MAWYYAVLLPYHGNSGKGEVPFVPEAWSGYFREAYDNLDNSPAQAYAQKHRGLSFRHDIYSKDRLPNRP